MPDWIVGRNLEKGEDMRSKTVVSMIMVALILTAAVLYAEEKFNKKETKPVLVVMDVQNIWMPYMAEADKEAAPAKINEAIALFREHGYPVILVYHSDDKRGPEPGTEDFEFTESIAIQKGDPRIVKAYPSAFTKTDLEQMLNDNERNTVFLCGLSATGCVLATYFGAMEREFTVLMVEDALLSQDASYTDVIEKICYSVTMDEMRDILENPFQ